MDETSQKIIDAAMILVRDKGYVATTTKEIARLAGLTECTLFRKFESWNVYTIHINNMNNLYKIILIISIPALNRMK